MGPRRCSWHACGITPQSVLSCSLRAPLAWAAEKGWLEVVRELLKYWADVDMLSQSLSSLGRAALSNKPAIVEELLKAGAKPVVENSTCGGPTKRQCFPALHCAARACMLRCLSLLLAGGALGTARDCSGRMAHEALDLEIFDDRSDSEAGMLWKERQHQEMLRLAVLLTLMQGPAARARSWCWPARGFPTLSVVTSIMSSFSYSTIATSPGGTTAPGNSTSTAAAQAHATTRKKCPLQQQSTAAPAVEPEARSRERRTRTRTMSKPSKFPQSPESRETAAECLREDASKSRRQRLRLFCFGSGRLFGAAMQRYALKGQGNGQGFLRISLKPDLHSLDRVFTGECLSDEEER